MSKVWVKEITHLGGTATFKVKELPNGAWIDVFIRSGSSDVDVADFKERINDWKKEKEENGIEVIELPNS